MPRRASSSSETLTPGSASSVEGGDIAKLEDRIKSRLQCGLVVDLHPTDYELRLGILQTRLERYRAAVVVLRSSSRDWD